MKKIVSSLLINVLFLQAAGCYSENTIMKELLYTENEYDIRVVTKDKKEYNGIKNYWQAKNDTLLFYNSNYFSNEIIHNKQKIPFSTIEEVYVNKLDGGKTSTLIFVIVGAALVTGLIVVLSNMKFGPDFSNMHLNLNFK